MPSNRVYSPYAQEAAQLLGARIRLARMRRRWTVAELAERAGVTRFTLSKVERGDPSVGLGVAFEAAALVGVPLFDQDRRGLGAERAGTRDQLALLGQRVRTGPHEVKDDF